MEKFIKKTILIIGATFTFFFLLGLFPNVIYDHVYPNYKLNLDFVNSKSAEILFVGDSRMVSSVVSNQIPNSRNIGLVGSTPIEGYFLLKKYFDNGFRAKSVFVSYAWDRLGNEYHPEIIIQRGLPIGLYDYDSFVEILNVSIEIDQDFRKKIGIKNYLYAKTNSPILIGSILKEFRFSNYQTNLEIYDKLNEQNGHITSVWGKNRICESCKSGENAMNHFRLKPIYDYYLRAMIELCIKNKIRLIFETIPFNESNTISSSVYKEFKKYIEELSFTYPNAILKDTLFYYPDNLYEDPHHLKPEGAEIYTEYLIEKFFN